MFNVPVGMPCWGLGENEPLITALFLLIVSLRNWKGPQTICGSDWGRGAVREFELECKREREHTGPVKMEGNPRQVLE